jgi:hypothetical protein
MCTLLLGRDVAGPGTLWVAANRDESPSRPSLPPQRWPLPGPPVVAGRDLRAGGTWLAVRGGPEPAVCALLNRRPGPDAEPGRRSRGTLPLALVTAADPAREVHARLTSGDYAPCSVVWASPRACWVASLAPAGTLAVTAVPPGWHVLTHTTLDDPDEPRAAALLARLPAVPVHDTGMMLAALQGLLAAHDPPEVCLHHGPMQTVSSACVGLDPGAVRFLHREGRACDGVMSDRTPCFADPLPEETT